MPGGVSSPVRAFKGVGGTPIFIARGAGAIVEDVDQNQYIDYVGSFGPLIVGHANDRVVAAAAKAMGRGACYGAPTELETQLAGMIVEALPAADMVRFVNSGTEAAMSVVRLARAATGRDLLVKCIGCYHGHVDSLLVQAGSGALTMAEAESRGDANNSAGGNTPPISAPSSPGIPRSLAATTLLTPYNDLHAAERLFDERGAQIAAFLVEPVAGNMGVVPPEAGYLDGLRELCTKHGALLIFDEVMTGFRVGWGGAQALYDAAPDLTCLGKIIGGGLPVGAYAGRRSLMEMVSPAGSVYQAGTLSGNPLAMSAGLATLEILREGAGECYVHLEKSAETLMSGLIGAAHAAGVALTVNRVGSMLTPFFTRMAGAPVRNFDDAMTCDTAAYAVFFHAMLERGVFLPPSQFEAWFVSTAHEDLLIESTLSAAKESFDAVAKSRGS